MESLYYTTINSPIGELMIASDSTALREIRFQGGRKSLRPPEHWISGSDLIESAAGQLAEYFAGDRLKFDLPLSPRGTMFQQKVWLALMEIPYGETISYGELARRIRKPTASRAVGAANGSNPLPIVIPCHRVIGSNGTLVGYGGGLPIKQQLLELESTAVGV